MTTGQVGLAFMMTGALLCAVSIPLILERVPPNRHYGLRTRKTLSNERVWYAANRVGGRDLLLAGAGVVLSACAVAAAGDHLSPAAAAALAAAVLVAGTSAAALHSISVAKRL